MFERTTPLHEQLGYRLVKDTDGLYGIKNNIGLFIVKCVFDSIEFIGYDEVRFTSLGNVAMCRINDLYKIRK